MFDFCFAYLALASGIAGFVLGSLARAALDRAVCRTTTDVKGWVIQAWLLLCLAGSAVVGWLGARGGTP